jgi:hypothetical protein
MRLINSGDIKKLLDEKPDPGELFDFDDDTSSPCWEAKVDKEGNRLVFLIDAQEILSSSLSNFGESELTIDRLVYFIRILKEGDYERLKKQAKAK